MPKTSTKTQAEHLETKQGAPVVASMPEMVRAEVTGIPAVEVRPSGGVFLVKAVSPSVWAQPSTWIALVALVVSTLSLIATIVDKVYGLRKDKRSREQSIQDEFWLRKVLFPSAVEPAMNFMAETIATLPAASAEGTVRLAYFSEFQGKLRDHARKLMLVATLWPNVYERLNGAFEAFEDVVADYCSEAVDPANINMTSHTTATNDVSKHLSTFYSAILNHQNSIGTRETMIQRVARTLRCRRRS